MSHEPTTEPGPGPRRVGATPPELKADPDAGLTADEMDVFDPGDARYDEADEASGEAARLDERAAGEPKSWREPYVLEAADRAASHECLAEDEERRFSPAVAFGIVVAVAMLAVVFAFLSGRA
jgi:hypothetical protein